MRHLTPAAPGAAAPFDFSREDQLLLCCARVDLTPHDREHLLALTAAPLDWQSIVWETRRQAIVPLVYRHLHATVPDRVPAEILDQLRAEYLKAAVNSLALAAELHAITRLLETHGIAALPYKGPVLALQAYGDIALRTFGDLDVLVPRGEVARAREILATRGYAPLDPLTESQEQAVLRFDHNLPLVRSGDRIVLELHWRVAPAAFTFTMPMEDLWSRASLITLGGATVRAMAVNDLVIVLAVHGSRHAWGAVEWIAGIAELMRRPADIDWDEVMANARQYHVERTVRLAVSLANRLLGAPIPDRVARWIDGDQRMPGLVAWVARRLFNPPPDVHSGSQQWALFRYELAVKDGVVQSLVDGFRRLTYPTGQDWDAAGIPDALFPLYRLMRPVRLFGRFVRHALLGR